MTLTAADNGTTLVGTYTVRAGDNSNDLTVSSFSIGTVTDIVGNAMSGTTVPDANIASGSAIVIEATAPTITSFTSTTADGSYKSADDVNITATASEAVVADNTITATLDTGDNVTLTAADNGTTLVGTYTVSAGDNSNDLTVSSFSIGTVTDIAGNAMASTTVPDANIASGSAIVIDTTAPTVSGVEITGEDGIQNNFLNVGDNVSVTVTFSENSPVTGTPQLTLAVGDDNRTADYTSSGSGDTTKVFKYTIRAEDNDTNGISIRADALALNNGTIMDLAENNAILTHSVVDNNSSYKVDTTAPSVDNFTLSDTALKIR